VWSDTVDDEPLVGLLFPIPVSPIGTATTFLLLAGLGVCAMLVARAVVPETTGRVREQLETDFKQVGATA
jgi:major inositol transporter-like SP family MFS transporter